MVKGIWWDFWQNRRFGEWERIADFIFFDKRVVFQLRPIYDKIIIVRGELRLVVSGFRVQALRIGLQKRGVPKFYEEGCNSFKNFGDSRRGGFIKDSPEL